MAGSGRILVSNNAESVGVHLAQWRTSPTAVLSVAEALELVHRIQKAVAEVKAAATASDADDDYSDIA